MKESSTLEGLFGLLERSFPPLEVNVGARMAKDYSLPYFEASQVILDGTLHPKGKSSLLEG
jgi:hypothetical protein